MASSFTTESIIELQGNGENDTTWGDKANVNFQILDRASNGVGSIAATSTNTTLTATNATLANWHYKFFDVTGVSGNLSDLIIPSQKKVFGASLTATDSTSRLHVKTATGTGVILKDGEKAVLYNDGTNVEKIVTSYQFVADPSYGNIGHDPGFVATTAPGTASIRTITGTANEIVVTNGSGATGDPVVSFATSLTLPSGASIASPTLTGAVDATTVSTFHVNDSGFRIVDNGDNSRAVEFPLDSLSAGQTRQIIFPDANTTLVGDDVTQTLTNKTLTSPDINGGTIDNATIGATTPAAAVVTTGRATAGRIINQSTATNYTLVLTDAGKTIEQSNSSANTITIPPNASVAYPVGADVAVVQTGTGVLSIAEGAGVTVNSRGALSDSAGQYAVLWLYKQASDTWVLTGDLA